MTRPPWIRPALETLMDSGESHAWTLEELQDALGRRGLPSSFSSVFRIANQAVALGHWRKIVLEDGRPRFEPAERHHDHLHCERCGSLEAVPCTFTASVRIRMEQATGYAIRDHSFLWQGLCPRCRQSSDSTARTSKTQRQTRRPQGTRIAKRPC
ncbi:ferric uptake regulator, Fur family [mine drainage metagenome]|uniref:Ferric uptake regulator, Fur family n=1 Tax=mine drainage metagenome TaxID=410659 RepID=T1B8V1_9ZZZZ